MSQRPAVLLTLAALAMMSTDLLGICPRAFESQRLRVLSYNVEKLRPGRHSHDHLRQVATLLASSEADVILLQEVGARETLSELTATEGGFEPHFFEGQAERHIHQGALVRIDGRQLMATPLDPGWERFSHRHPYGLEPLFPRRQTVLLLEEPGHAPVLVLGLHLKSLRWRGGVDPQQVRAAQLAALAQVISELRAAYGTGAPVIAGDFNSDLAAGLEAGGFGPLAALGLSEIVGPEVAPEERFTHVWHKRSRNDRVEPIKQQLDGIVVPRTAIIHGARILHEARGLSDHVPVSADFTLPAPTGDRP